MRFFTNNNYKKWSHFLAVLCLLPSLVLANAFDEKLADIRQKNDPSAALVLFKGILEQPISVTEQLAVYKEITGLYLEQGELDRALSSAQAMVQMAQENSLDTEVAKANKLEAIVYYYMGDYQKAIDGYQSTLVHFRLTNDYIQQAHLLNNIGLVQSRISEYDSALLTLQEAKTLYQTHGSELDKVDIKHNIAVLYSNLRQYDNSIELYQEVLEWHLVNSDDAQINQIYAEISVPFKQAQQYEKAKEYILKAIGYYDQTGRKYELASSYHNVSEIFYELTDFASAKQYGSKAVELSEELGHKKALSGALFVLARAEFAQGNSKMASEILARSSDIASESNDLSLIVEISWLNSLILASQKNYTQAIHFYNKASKGKHQLSNEALNVQMARYQSRELSQKVIQLQQEQELNSLQNEQSRQRWIAITIALILLSFTAFFLYSRNIERYAKVEMEERLKLRASKIDQLNKELSQTIQLKKDSIDQFSVTILASIAELEQEIQKIAGQEDLDEACKQSLDNMRGKIALIKSHLI